MKNTSETQNFSTPAWLLLGLVNSVPGRLKLQNGQLIFTANNAGTLWRKGLERLERKTGISGLATKLRHGQATPLFKVSVSDIQAVRSPFYYFSAGLHLTIDGKKYRISFIQPNNTRSPNSMTGIGDIRGAREIGKRWKSLLGK